MAVCTISNYTSWQCVAVKIIFQTIIIHKERDLLHSQPSQSPINSAPNHVHRHLLTSLLTVNRHGNTHTCTHACTHTYTSIGEG